jgi:hypothetical protein
MCHHANCRYGVNYYSVIMFSVIITSAITLYCYAEWHYVVCLYVSRRFSVILLGLNA